MGDEKVFIRVAIAVIGLCVAITFIIACAALNKATKLDNMLNNMSTID